MYRPTKKYCNPHYMKTCEDDIRTANDMASYYIQPQEQTYQQPSNQIFFYDEVSSTSILALNKKIAETTKHLQMLQIQYSLENYIPIHLYINSPGGDVFSALATTDIVKTSKIPIYTYVEGVAASAATFISVCAAKRYMRRNSFFLIHAMSSGVEGKYEEIKDEAQNVDLFMKYIKKIYLENTKVTEPELDQLLKHEWYLDADDALKYGFVDEIL